MAKHRDWSFLTREYLEELYRQFGNWKKVAEHLDIHHTNLLRIRKDRGMEIWQYPHPENRVKRPNRLDPLMDRIFEMARSGMNCGEIAREIQDDPEQVREFLAYHGIARQNSGARLGDKNPKWKGGRSLDADGYILVLSRDHPFRNRHGYVRLHRMVMEEKLGRFLDPDEVVHHMDGNKENNDPDNLELFDNNGDHIRHEWEDPAWKEHQRAIRRGVPSRRGTREGSESGAYGW